MKNILILIGGWHFPYEFYNQISNLSSSPDLNIKKFVVSHRNLDDEIVFKEKEDFIKSNWVFYLDKILYSKKLTKQQLKEWNIEYKEYPNIIGDYYFINQYFSDHDDIPDYLFFFHDDNYITDLNLVKNVVNNDVDTYYYLNNDKIVCKIKDDNWLHLGNCFYENRFIPRGSFAVFKKELLVDKNKFLKFDNIKLNRTEEIVSPSPDELSVLQDWDNVCRNFTNYMTQNNMQSKSYRLSDVRRKSTYLLEGKRGFLRTLN